MSKRKSIDLLPVIFRTDANTRFLAGTVDQLIQQPKLKKIDGFIGDRAAVNYNPSTDAYINSENKKSLRTDYELEPGIVIRNSVTDKVEFSKTYEDILNSLKFYGSDIDNQDRLFKQQSYSLDLHIDLDKFINYRNYVWLPEGPPTVLVSGAEKVTSTTISVGVVSDTTGESWKLSNDSVAVNPTVTLYRGMTYIFDVDTVDNPFYIKTKRTSGSLDALAGVINNGTMKGKVIFEVTENIPSTLFYVSGKDNATFGKFLVRNKTENTSLNVDNDIIGKKNYGIAGKFNFTNGMKIKFSNTVMPETYREKTYIVEGVGKSITLVDFESLVTIESYATEVETSFDQTAFDDLPFDQVSDYPVNPDYILINRASQDKNPWSRYNRWFHVDVVTLSSELNNVEPYYGSRANRPIIEFEPNLQLFNFSISSKKYVDYLDTRVTDAFSQVEGSVGYFVDGLQLQNGNRVIFTAEKDPNIKNKVFEVQFLNIDGDKRLHLELVSDSEPLEGQGLLVLSGNDNGGTTWLYKNNEWTTAQRKTGLNQSPLFDLFDENGLSFSDSTYKNSEFLGTKIFGYQVGTGANDSVLGFPLKYNNISNVGGYLFENYLATGSSNYFNNQGTISVNYFKNGFLKLSDDSYVNSWIKTNALSIQEIIDEKIAEGGEEYLEFNSLDIQTPANAVRVFKNGKLLASTAYTISIDATFDAYYINFTTALLKNDVIVIRALPLYDKGIDGKYETPINLVNNPLNENPTSISFAEINDHVNSIVLNATKALGVTVDKNNLRDLTNLSQFGRRFVQHDGLVSIAGAMLTDKSVNAISSIRWAALEYQRYKTQILQKFADLPGYTSISSALDDILIDIGKDKTVNSPFYFSDMVPYGLNKRDYEYTVRDENITSYAYGSKIFSPLELNNNAVLVYLNGKLLLKDINYIFDTVEPLVTISNALSVGDKIVLRYYNNIYGACMPYSPTKMGLYPAFIPTIYNDTTYIQPTDVIQGHDGSITICYGDDRDALLLELETRIYNNLTSFYDNRVFDLTDVIPGIFRSDKASLVRVNRSIEEEFLRWSGLYNIDYSSNENEIYGGNFSYNFVNAVGELNPEIVLNGSWRKIYKYYFDTDRPHSHPWEMLGFSIKPTWWEDEYGPAPYSSGNDVLWNDLELGYIRQGDRQGYDPLYKRPGLSNIIPVDSYGELKDPFDVNVVRYFDFSRRYDKWKFGDMGPAESSWRRSHMFPFALQIAMALNAPSKYLTLCFDTSRNKFNKAGQIVYSETGQRVTPSDLKVFSDVSPSFIFATGYSPYLVEHLRTKHTAPAVVLKNYINNIKSNLIYKVGGFASKSKFKVALETVSSYKTVDNVFVPDENYQMFLSSGNPIKTLSMSGIIVERSDKGFTVKGYDTISPYFKINNVIHSPSDPLISVGGVTESFIYWSANSNINGGSIVAVGQKFYRAVSTHVTKEAFDPSMYYPLPYLPTIGGVEATLAQNFEETITTIPYGTIYNSVQDVFDFILGYGNYLQNEGFIFDKILDTLEVVADWKLAGKEFLFWSVQNWATNSVISLAPFADTVKFYSSDAVVDDVNDIFYNFVMLKSDGSPIDKRSINIVRDEGTFTIDTAKISNDGVYFVKINLVQKEHVVVFDNFTIFNDLIYQPYSGYRQSRFKVSGYVTDNWNGDFYVPGFVYDSAMIDDWQSNVDYSIGDVVKYQTRYYQARTRLLPSETFNYEDWSELGDAPVAKLLPNFEYKISQFEEFYDLDSENFDSTQKRYAQKLTGYVPRNYLNSLIVDETSQYKFYQGFIREKGTVAPLEKFSVASNETLGSHVGIQEEWAIRLGTFGGENTYKEIEFTLDQDKFNQNPQLFEFVYGDNTSTSSKSYSIDRTSLTISPVDYNGQPWPTLPIVSEGGTNGYMMHQTLPTAGYVRIDDVTFTALYENNILALGTSGSLQEGDTVWVAMDGKGDWKVKRYTKSTAKIINYQLDNANNLIEFITDVAHGLRLRDFVSISRLEDPLNGVYEVIGINTPTTFVVSTTYNDIADASGVLDGSLYFFLTTRFDNFDGLASIPGIARWKNCEYAWVDDDGTGNWVVLEKENGTVATPLRPYKQASDQNFGQTVAIAPYSNIIAVGATTVERGRIYVYRREVLGTNEIQLDQSYLVEENFSDILSVQTIKNGVDVPEMPRNHGATIGIWENADLTLRYIASGAPNASNVKWISPGVNYANQPFKKPVTYGYSSSGVFDEGLVKIVKYDDLSSAFITDIVLASPIVQISANFGHKLKLVGSTSPFMIVSSPGQDQSTGSVFLYYLDSSKNWQVYLINNTPFDFRSQVSQISSGADFGWDIASTTDGNTVAISAPYFLKDNTQAHTGAVFVFEKNAVDYSYTLKQTVYADDFLEPGDLLLKGITYSYNTTEQTLVFDAVTYTLTRNRGNFIQDGFRTGQSVKVTGSRFNNFEFVISGISVSTLTFKPSEQMSTENVTTVITITGLGSARKDRFGDKLAITADGSTLLISSDHASQSKLDAGMVYVMNKDSSGQYKLSQKMSSPSSESGEMFGSNIDISPDGNLILVTAAGGDQASNMYFDSYVERYTNSFDIYGSEYVLNPKSALRPLRTTFDSGSTRFINSATDSGVVYMYQKLGNYYVFGESLVSGDAASADGYGTGLATNGEFILVGAPKYEYKLEGQSEEDPTKTVVNTYTDAGTVLFFDKTSTLRASQDVDAWSWTKVRSMGAGLVDVDKIKKAFTYDTEHLEILENYEIYDPVKGKIPSKVLQEIKYITPYDPAVYTVAVEVNNKNRVDNKTTWTGDHVGEMWLDTSTLRYMWYEQGSAEFRINNWGKLFPGATVDVYEWVKSDYRPSEWAELADTEEGLANGISGQPKNPDNTVVSINQYYDPIINDFVNVYYFWVRNKITLPDLSFRSISSFECARIIEDPKTQGIKYAAFLSPSSLALANTQRDFDASKVSIDIYYQDTDIEVNRHSHWQIINENNKYFNLDPVIERKMFDSLVGQDISGNVVPDPKLSPKLKYGTLANPRQSWFVKREVALKTLTLFVNNVLAKYDTVGKVNLDNISVYDEAPLENLGYYDEVIDTSLELSSIGTVGKQTGALTAEVINGRLVNVVITNPGVGYKIAPTVDIIGDGTGAKIQTAIDLSGSIVSVKILNQGTNYTTAPKLIVRPYAVLVTLDMDIDKWAIYHSVNNVFERKSSQTYDVRKYWNYTDWVASDYNVATPPKFVLDFITDLETVDYSVGDTVKIRNTGDGKAIILRKTAEGYGNYLSNYDLIYRELGTIQFSEKMYNRFIAGLGFDTFVGFDRNGFDESNAIELRKILTSIKNDIFIGELAGYWNKFIFVAIRYVLSEQLFVDWVYKTSFITPVIEAGELNQKNVYRFNDFSYVEEFIKEIKPYKSKIREITTNHQSVEKLGVGVTDFDLPAYVDLSGKIVLPQGTVIESAYPFKHWYDHKGFEIKSINIAEPGSGYRIPPEVVITPAIGDTGSGASAFARISDGKLSEIVVTNPGSGYLSTPTVSIIGGGNYDTNFVQGKASALLTNGYIRTSEITLKFDRTSEKGLFTGQYYSRNFTTDGTTLNYVLAYPIGDLDDNYPALQNKDTIKIYLNEVQLSEDTHRITFRPDLSTIITFNVALPAEQNLRIQYIKNILYTKDVYSQSTSNYRDEFQLTFPPELDNQKIVINSINSTTGVGYIVPSSDYLIKLVQTSVGGKYIGSIKFKNVPSIGSLITVQYAKNINIQNAVDRIITSYEPTSGMPGKDVSQLLKGVEFGGVQIQGLNFSVSSGWDGLPWFTQGWDTFVNDYKDLLVISDGVTDTYDLGYVPLLGTQINVYFDGVRVDDENWPTPTNPNALFKTIIANGASSTITLPIWPQSGSKIEIRQSMSDGVNLPSDEFVMDTSLSGGDFTTVKDALETRFKTATGLRPDDISVDGGQFLSVEHSPSTEELVKGEIFDTLTMTVFNSPSSGSNLVKTYQYLYDGTNPTYEIEGYVDSTQSVDVYINNFATDRNTDFTITSLGNGNTLITLTTDKYGLDTANTNDKISVTIQNMSIGGKNILSRQNYIVTTADYSSNTIEIESTVNIDDVGSFYVSVANESTLVKKSSKSKRAKLVITNSPKLAVGSLITFITFSSTIRTYSEVYNQELTINTNNTYTLSRPPGNIEPLHVMAAVTRLTPANTNWQGKWVENFGYNVDDTVLFGNRTYICIAPHVSLYSLTEIVFSSWISSNNYAVGDIVNFGQYIYICIADHTSNNSTNTPTNNMLWAIHVGNRPDEDYSNNYWNEMPTQRMLPPETEYYEVTSDAQTFDLGKNFPYLSRSLSVSDIEVYRNGKIMATNRDYEFDNVTNTVKLSSGVSYVGDVIAISVLRGADYYIRNGAITFTGFAKLAVGQKIVVTTYTNHDENLMRREVYKGKRFQNEYKVSRRILSINNVWVDMNGRPLIPNVDYDVRDNFYIKISERFTIGEDDRIVITSINEVTSVDPVAYRMFKDMTNKFQFKRISKHATTSLSQELLPTDREIHVDDATIFGTVQLKGANPGVIFIGGERIEFLTITGNTLGNITRGTKGTGVSNGYPAGSKVFNSAQSETIPYKEGNIIQTFTSPANYRYNETLDVYQHYVNGSWSDTGVSTLGQYELIDFRFNDSIPYEDQVSVSIAGNLLLKPTKSGNPIIKHDFSITLDSDEVNSLGQTGDVEVDPDFTISKVNGSYILQINKASLLRDETATIIPDIQIKVVQKVGKIWYTLNGDQTLQQDSTVQAKFLQEFPAELPDKNYYGISES